MKNLDSKFLRKTLSKYSTGVTVVTSTDNDGNPIGYYKNTNEYNTDFVISTAPSSAIYSDTKMVSINEFSKIMVRGKADRYDGKVEISLNNSMLYYIGI